MGALLQGRPNLILKVDPLVADGVTKKFIGDARIQIERLGTRAYHEARAGVRAVRSGNATDAFHTIA